MVRILCVMDNVVSGNKGLTAKHGLSLYLEAGERKLLFDFGQGRETWENGRRLGVPFHELDYLVFSHSHYDHCAGFLWAENFGINEADVTAVLGSEKAFFQEKYAKDQDFPVYLGCGFTKTYLRQRTGQQWICEDVLALGKGLWAVGGFDRIHPEEIPPARFVKEAERGVMVPDSFDEEICLAAETKKGLAVIAGCSHPGIINMVETVIKKLNRPVFAVIGGTHLTGTSKERLLWTGDALKRLGVELAAFNHCTGTAFASILSEKGIRGGCFGAGSCLYL